MNDEKDLMKVDERTQERVIESLVLRGDLSGLAPKDRARFYVQVCEGLGLNPASNPLAFLRLNGKGNSSPDARCDRSSRAYPPREPRDHRRPEGHRPRRDEAGLRGVPRKHPDGRMETAVATVPLVDPVNVLMKAETKSKRRATLSILGLGMLDEMELETIPASAQEPGGGVDLAMMEESSDEVEGTNERDAPRPRGLLRGPRGDRAPR